MRRIRAWPPCAESALLFVCVVIGAVLAGWPMQAHHSVLRFDSSRAVVIDGVVRQVVWAYPHAYLAMDVPIEGAPAERWIIESESPAVLARLGWTRSSIGVGDRIRTAGAASRDGARIMRCDVVALPDGSSLPCYPQGALPARGETGSR